MRNGVRHRNKDKEGSPGSGPIANSKIGTEIVRDFPPFHPPQKMRPKSRVRFIQKYHDRRTKKIIGGDRLTRNMMVGVKKNVQYGWSGITPVTTISYTSPCTPRKIHTRTLLPNDTHTYTCEHYISRLYGEMYRSTTDLIRTLPRSSVASSNRSTIGEEGGGGWREKDEGGTPIFFGRVSRRVRHKKIHGYSRMMYVLGRTNEACTRARTYAFTHTHTHTRRTHARTSVIEAETGQTDRQASTHAQRRSRRNNAPSNLLSPGGRRPRRKQMPFRCPS